MGKRGFLGLCHSDWMLTRVSTCCSSMPRPRPDFPVRDHGLHAQACLRASRTAFEDVESLQADQLGLEADPVWNCQ